jgi:hypothetical protein
VFLPHSADFGKQLSGAVYRDFGQAIEVKKIPEHALFMLVE